MSTALTSWTCNACRQRLRARLALAIQRQRSGFVSLSEIGLHSPEDLDQADTKTTERRETEKKNARVKWADYKKARDRSAYRKSPSKWINSKERNLREDQEEELKRLFKSTGREYQSGPLKLRYSQITLPGNRPERAPQQNKGQSQGLDFEQELARREPETHRRQDDTRTHGKSKKAFTQKHVKAQNKPVQTMGGRPAWPVLNLDTAETPKVKARMDQEDILEQYVFSGFRWHSLVDTDPLFDITLASKWPRIMRYHIKRKDYGRAEAEWRTYELNLLNGKGPKNDSVLFTDLTLFLHWAVTGKLKTETLSIWQTIQARGFTPSLRHWTMMLRMAGWERDLTSVRAVWHSIKQRKERPDNRTWSVLLHSIVSCHKVRWQDVLGAFQEMFDQWKWLNTPSGRDFLEKQGERREMYGPNVIPFNAALFRILSYMPSHSQDLLDLMRAQGIKPNVNTFNILMNIVSRTGDMNEVRRLLAEMKEHDVKSDKITFTAVLDGFIRRLSDASTNKDEAEVETEIKNVFKAMDEANYLPSHHTYATALSALLGRAVPIVGAARVVMEHMERNHVEPTEYILTILVEHYMRPDNPQIGVAEAVYRRARSKRLIMDRHFYDVMVRGYARCGEIDKMLRMIRFIPRTGQKLSWLSMLDALDLLVDRRELTVARELVDDLEQGKGMGRYGCSQPKEGAVFWARVDELRDKGLLYSSASTDMMVGRHVDDDAGLQEAEESSMLADESLDEDDDAEVSEAEDLPRRSATNPIEMENSSNLAEKFLEDDDTLPDVSKEDLRAGAAMIPSINDGFAELLRREAGMGSPALPRHQNTDSVRPPASGTESNEQGEDRQS